MQGLRALRIATMTMAAVMAVVLVPAGCGPGTGPSAARPGSAPMVLLDGRLRFTPPAAATLSPYQDSIMAAPSASAEESRVILVPGDELAHFVLGATEVFATVDDDPARRRAAIEAWVGADARFDEVVLADGAVAIEYVPTTPVGDRPLRVYGAVVVMPDRTAIALDYYILPGDADQRAAWVTQARALTRTVVRGDRPLETAARTVRFDGIALDVPAGTIFTSQPGPDFAVYRLRPLGPLGGALATLGIYIGRHPSYQHAQAADDGAVAVAVEAGTLLGQPADWQRWSSDGVAFREAMISRDGRDAVHVFALAPVGDAAAAATLAAMVASMRPVPTED